MRMTTFQKKVLSVAKTIPRGEVRTYKWVAKECGAPGASRAVGSALSKNAKPFIIPCHRVIRSDGKVGGFVFGESRKVKLLKSEGLTVERGTVIIEKRKRT